MRRFTLFTVLLCLLLSLTAVAQERGNISIFYLLQAHEGQNAQLEAGLNRHRAFHQSAGDKFVWRTWQVVNGPNTGAYLVGALGHHWRDFEAQDALGAKDAVDVGLNITPHARLLGSDFWALQTDLTLAREDGPPARFVSVTHFRLKPDKVVQFRAAITKINEAVTKVDPQGRRTALWYALASGGDGPTYALVQERRGWADFEPTGRGVWQMMEEAFGREETERTRAAFTSSFTGTHSFILRYRPDLSSSE